MSDTSDTNSTTPSQVDCPPSREPAVKWFIIAAMLIGVGVWCWSDRSKGAPTGDINQVSTYYLNNYGPFLMVPAGILLAAFAARFLTRTLTADAEGIGYPDHKIAWGDVKELDATKLAKGYLYIRHGDGRTLTLDSYKLQNFHDLVKLIEQHVPADRQTRA
jgi:hypothetical protein